LTSRVIEVLKEMNRKSLQTLIIVTRADTIAIDSRFSHQHAIARKFNVPDYKVCLVTNYTKSREKDFTIDKVTLRIFAEITQIADTYAKTYVRYAPSPSPSYQQPQPAYQQPQPTYQQPQPSYQKSPQQQPISPMPTSPPASPQRMDSFSTPPSSPHQQVAPPSPEIAAANTITAVTINFAGKKAQIAVADSTTFESLLATAAQKAKLNPADYCLASQLEGGLEYGLKDLVRATLPYGETQLYLRKDEGFL
jgi:hypothetical protein